MNSQELTDENGCTVLCPSMTHISAVPVLRRRSPGQSPIQSGDSRRSLPQSLPLWPAMTHVKPAGAEGSGDFLCGAG
jgi:hypothetical protein